MAVTGFIPIALARLDSDNYQFLSHWFDLTMVETRVAHNLNTYQNGRRMLNSFGHPIWWDGVLVADWLGR